MSKPYAYLIRGLPGSGKSTLGRMIAENLISFRSPAEVMEADDFFTDKSDGSYNFDPAKLDLAHLQCQLRFHLAMIEGRIPIVCNTFTRRWEIKPYERIADSMGWGIMEIICRGNFNNTHGVPEDAIRKMRERWED